MSAKELVLGTVLLVGIAVTSFSQQNPNPAANNTFVGSTPCGKFILSTLRIPSSAVCAYMKWELTLLGTESLGEFKLAVSYGDWQPNTMYFKDGGSQLEITGRYTSSQGTPFSARRKVYHLTSDKIQGAIELIEMDGNILHFADTEKNLLVGDASFGRVLNRIK